jgi:hypothetical protein
MLDGGIELDLERVMQNIDEADVLTIYFPLLGKTLIVDTRWNEDSGPLIAVVPIAQDSTDRYRSFHRLRPSFPRPKSLSMIPWTNRVDSLQRLGIWSHVVARLESAAPDPSYTFVDAAESCFCELRELEVRELLRAVSGEQYETLWASTTPERN